MTTIQLDHRNPVNVRRLMKAEKERECSEERQGVGVLSLCPAGAHFAPAGQFSGSKTIRAYA